MTDRQPRRHGARVTADRLLEAVEQWPGRFTPDEVKAAHSLAERLSSIAAHDRTGTETGWRCSCGSSVALPGLGKAELDRLFTRHAGGDKSEQEPGP